MPARFEEVNTIVELSVADTAKVVSIDKFNQEIFVEEHIN